MLILYQNVRNVRFVLFTKASTIVRTSCFDTEFASQMKLTELPLIHCFEFNQFLVIGEGKGIQLVGAKMRTKGDDKS